MSILTHGIPIQVNGKRNACRIARELEADSVRIPHPIHAKIPLCEHTLRLFEDSVSFEDSVNFEDSVSFENSIW